MLGRSASGWSPAVLIPLVYPIADLILLAILLNMLLANRTARRTLFLWSCGLVAFLVSDYIYSLLAPVNGFQTGGLESLGWMLGGLIFGWGRFSRRVFRLCKTSRSGLLPTWEPVSRTSCPMHSYWRWVGSFWPSGASAGRFPGRAPG